MTARSIHLPSLGHARQLIRDLDQASMVLTDETVTKIHRRARLEDPVYGDRPEQITSAGDGYPGGGSGGGGSPSACNCDVDALDAGGDCPHGSSTERAALGRTAPDPVLASIGEFFTELAEARGLIVRLSRRADALLTIAAEKQGRQSSVDSCRVCGRTIAGTEHDRPRQGACDACYRRYRKWSSGEDDPSWVRFIAQQRPKDCGTCEGEGFIVDRYDGEQRPCPTCAEAAAS